MNSSNSHIDLAHRSCSKQLKQLREKQRLTKADLAEKAGLTYRTVHDLEEGRRPRIQKTTLIALAEALGVGPESLLAETQPEVHQPTSSQKPRHILSNHTFLKALIIIIVASFALFAVRHFAVSNARWTIEDQTIVGHDRLFGSTLWQYHAQDQINNVTNAPWSEGELILGLHNLRGKHGPIQCLNRSNGKIRWSQLLDIQKPMNQGPTVVW